MPIRTNFNSILEESEQEIMQRISITYNRVQEQNRQVQEEDLYRANRAIALANSLDLFGFNNWNFNLENITDDETKPKTKIKEFKSNKGVCMKDKVQDLKNKYKIYKIVSDHFSLTKESLKLFKYRLFSDPHISKEYKKFLGDSEDLRRRIDLKGEDLEYIDEGWKIFKKYFIGFIQNYNNIDHGNQFTYKNYYRNKVVIRKQEVKLKKAIVNFYCKDLELFFTDFLTNINNSTNIKRRLLEIFAPKKVINFIDNKEGGEFLFKNNCVRVFSVRKRNLAVCDKNYDFLYGESFDFIKASKEIKDIINTMIMSVFEDIGKHKIPDKKLQLVLSLNYADWFLCSTAESWSSCLNLESDYSEARWTGLPGLIGDKNRALIYITDKKKKTYQGITVDRILSRSWVLTGRKLSSNKHKNKMNKKTEFFFVREYPIQYQLSDIFEKYLGINFIRNDVNHRSFVGKYYIELLNHNINKERDNLCYIFQDNTNLSIAKKNKAKYFPNKFGYLTFGGGGCPYLNYIKNTCNPFYTIENEQGFYYTGGLKKLINDGLQLRDYWRIY